MTNTNTSAVDLEAIGWAYQKLCAFGVQNSRVDNAMMMDRLNLMLLNPPDERPQHGIACETPEVRADCDTLRERLADLLTRTVNALRGEPRPLHVHSWHNLPELAAAIVAENKRLQSERPQWRDIADAPKDGTVILVSGGLAYWRERMNHWDGPAGWYTITGFDWPGKPIQWEVKHWMPQPKPLPEPVSRQQDGTT